MVFTELAGTEYLFPKEILPIYIIVIKQFYLFSEKFENKLFINLSNPNSYSIHQYID